MAELIRTPLFSSANLKAYYRLENVNDSSAGGFTLTNNGTVTFPVAKYNNGADFGTANTDKRLEVLNNLGIDGGAITVAGWFKMNTEITAGGYGALFGQASAGTDTWYEVYYTFDGGNRRLVFLRFGSALHQFSYDITLGTAAFYHIALTYDTTNVIGYVNGVNIGSVAASGSSAIPSIDSFVIGARNETGTPDLYANVTADDVAVFNTALTAIQIQMLVVGGPVFINKLRPRIFAPGIAR